MLDARIYPESAEKMDDLVAHLRERYEAEGYVTQTMKFEDEEDRGILFQVRLKEGTWQTVKNWTGLGMAGTATMRAKGDALEVEVGAGKWLDKAAVAAVSIVVLWPLLITAGIGAWGQRSFLNRLQQDIEAFFRKDAMAGNCKKCGSELPSAAKFCMECGNEM